MGNCNLFKIKSPINSNIEKVSKNTPLLFVENNPVVKNVKIPIIPTLIFVENLKKDFSKHDSVLLLVKHDEHESDYLPINRIKRVNNDDYEIYVSEQKRIAPSTQLCIFSHVQKPVSEMNEGYYDVLVSENCQGYSIWKTLYLTFGEFGATSLDGNFYSYFQASFATSGTFVKQ